MNLEERVDLLEFQVELLFGGSGIERYLYECKVTRPEYRAIMDYMDSVRSKIDKGEEIHHGTFESDIYKIVPEQNGNYHFCELLAKLFAENNRWEEVFPALYGDMPKYGGTIE